jgi:hypothetical protein
LTLLRRSRQGHWAAAGALVAWGGFQLLGLAHFLPFHPGVALAFAFVWGVGLVHPEVLVLATRRVPAPPTEPVSPPARPPPSAETPWTPRGAQRIQSQASAAR